MIHELNYLININGLLKLIQLIISNFQLIKILFCR